MLNIAYITWTGDATDIMGQSCSPITSMVMNSSPAKRYRPGGMLMLGMLPPKKKETNMSVLYDAILARMAADGCFTGFKIYDAFLKKYRTYRVTFALFIEDLKGLPYVLCCAGDGTHHGACPWCEVIGVYLSGCDRYFTAIFFLPLNSPIRADFKVEFAEVPGLNIYMILFYIFELISYYIRTTSKPSSYHSITIHYYSLYSSAVAILATRTAPRRMTMAEKVASGTRSNGVSSTLEPYFDVDAFTRRWGCIYIYIYR